MTTARDIVVSALEDVGVLGVGQTPLAEDLNFGLVRLNRMIGQFNRRRWLVYHLLDVACIATGRNVYTVGPGGNFNIPRPDRLEDGNYFRQLISGASFGDDFNLDFNNDFATQATPNPTGFAVDYKLYLIEARETYNLIALKNLGSWPQYVYYDPANPVGNLFIYPVPTAGQFEIHISVKDVLPTLANLSTVLVTPPEYEEAFEYNLALRFFAKYQIEPDPTVVGLAKAALATIRAANAQVPLLQLPQDLTPGGSRYNIFSDQSSVNR